MKEVVEHNIHKPKVEYDFKFSNEPNEYQKKDFEFDCDKPVLIGSIYPGGETEQYIFPKKLV